MGLLFKVEGVSASSSLYGSLSNLMLALCAIFIILWAVCVGLEMLARWRVLMGPLPVHMDGSDVVKPPRGGGHHQHSPAAHHSGAGKGLWPPGPEGKELPEGKSSAGHQGSPTRQVELAAVGVVNGSPAHPPCEDRDAESETQPLTKGRGGAPRHSLGGVGQ